MLQNNTFRDSYGLPVAQLLLLSFNIFLVWYSRKRRYFPFRNFLKIKNRTISDLAVAWSKRIREMDVVQFYIQGTLSGTRFTTGLWRFFCSVITKVHKIPFIFFLKIGNRPISELARANSMLKIASKQLISWQLPTPSGTSFTIELQTFFGLVLAKKEVFSFQKLFENQESDNQWPLCGMIKAQTWNGCYSVLHLGHSERHKIYYSVVVIFLFGYYESS